MTKHIIYQDFSEMIDTLDIPKGKRKVMIAALELFAEQGFDGTSTVQIAKRSGMCEANIFKYFKTKKTLLLAIITPIIENLFPAWAEEFRIDITQNNHDLRSLIRFAIQDRWSFLSANALAAAIILNEIITNDEVQSLFRTIIQRHTVFYGPQIMTAFQRTDEFNAESSYKTICRLFIGQLLSYFLERYKFSKEAEISQEQEKEDLAIIEDQIYKALRKS